MEWKEAYERQTKTSYYNREDERVLTHFLTVVKDNIDASCVPAWFMSDMAPQFYTS